MAELDIRMPALSATMEDAELLSWLVEVGDEVRSGQPLAEVATDKVDMELESPYDGTVAELIAEPGERVDLGAVVARITSKEEDLLGDLDLGGSGAEEDAPAAEPPRTDPVAEEPTGEPASGPRIVAAAPAVRKRAKELGLDLAEIPPTGTRGQVTLADLQTYQEQQQAASTPAPTSTPPAASTPAPTKAPTEPRIPARASRSRQDAIRLATARITTRSAAVPQFTLYRRLDMSSAIAQRDGRSWTTELARALAASLWRHPECNATWDEDAEELVPLDGVRIGIAVDSPDGLVTVGVDDPDAIGPDEADAQVRAAIARAREGKLTPSDMAANSTTISSLGGLGVDRFNALLVPPQATILSVGRIVETPVVVDGHVRVKPMMDVGLTVDHRVADGADGARLLETFATRLDG